MPPGSTPSLKGRALRYLAAREHSRAELEQKLRPYEEAPGQLQRVLDDLAARDLINEGRFVESVLHRRQDKLGNARLQHELARKGVDRDSIQQAIDRLKVTELERARQVLHKRFGPAELHPSPQQRARQLRFLASRGFAGDVAYRAVASEGADDVTPDP